MYLFGQLVMITFDRKKEIGKQTEISSSQRRDTSVGLIPAQENEIFNIFISSLR